MSMYISTCKTNYWWEESFLFSKEIPLKEISDADVDFRGN